MARKRVVGVSVSLMVMFVLSLWMQAHYGSFTFYIEAEEEEIEALLEDPGNETFTVTYDKKIVIIVAYMRSGSTFTGSLFQEYNNSFYVYEPIRYISDLFDSARTKGISSLDLTYSNGSKRTFAISDEWRVIMDEVNSWMTCQLDYLSWGSLTDTFHDSFTKFMKLFYQCVNRKYKSDQRQRAINKCLKLAISHCHKSSVIILKFIRMSMPDLEHLLPIYPNLKIIHLVRDPRGIVGSRVRLRKVATDEVQDICNQMTENLKSTKSILQKYPDRVKIVVYEDIAERPEEVVRETIEFTGLEFTKRMKSFTKILTASSRDTGPGGIERKDSYATANNWRKEVPFPRSNFIFHSCKTVSDILGYLPFHSAVSQADFKISSRKKVDVNKQLLACDDFWTRRYRYY